MKQGIKYFLIAYILFFTLDGLVSTLDEVLNFVTFNNSIFYARQSIAFIALALSPIYSLVVFYYKFQRKILLLLPAAFYLVTVIFSSCFSLSLADIRPGAEFFLITMNRGQLHHELPLYGVFLLFLSLLQLFTGFLLLKHVKKSAIDFTGHDRASKKMTNGMKSILATSVFIISYISIQALTLPSLIARLSKGYTDFDGFKFFSNEKVFKKGNTVVRLIPMVHIGEDSFYKELTENIGDHKTLFLLEGVKDEKKLLEKLSYDKLAEKLSLSEQGKSFDPESAIKTQNKEDNAKIIVADLDTSQFDKATVESLNKILKVLQFDDFVSVLSLLSGGDSEMITNGKTLFNDILIKRNNHLFKILEDNRSDYEEIIIPWGALHLPDIENKLLANEYEFLEDGKKRVTFDLVKTSE